MLENSGKLSLLPREKGDVSLPVVIISDGRILDVNLKQRGLNRIWLEKQLAQQKISSPQEVFLLTVDEYNAVFLIKKENSST